MIKILVGPPWSNKALVISLVMRLMRKSLTSTFPRFHLADPSFPEAVGDEAHNSVFDVFFFLPTSLQFGDFQPQTPTTRTTSTDIIFFFLVIFDSHGDLSRQERVLFSGGGLSQLSHQSSSRAAHPPSIDASLPPSVRNARASSNIRCIATADSTNATLSDCICPELDLTTVSLTVVGFDIRQRLVLPECVYTSGIALTSAIMSDIVLQSGNTGNTIKDPIARLPSSLVGLRFVSCIFMDPVGNNIISAMGVAGYAPNWDAIFSTRPSLTGFQVVGSNMVGTLPTALPSSITSFSLTQSRMTGTLPSTFFDNLNPTTDTFLSVDLSMNSLTGTIPGGLIHDLTGPGLVSLTLDLSLNNFSGSPPSTIFRNSNLDGLLTLQVFISRNQLTGSIPFNWLPGSSAPQLSAVLLDMSNNRLTGTIPLDILNTLSQSRVQSVIVRLEKNQLDGNFPATSFFSFASNSPQLSTVEFDVSDNGLTGTVPSQIFPAGASTPNLGTVLIAASNNGLSGSFPSTFFSNLPYISGSFRAEFNNNSLSGVLPPDLIDTGDMISFTFLIDDNSFIEPGFESLLKFPTPNKLNHVYISASGNQFHEAIPEIFCQNCSFGGTGTPSLYLNLSRNAIHGGIPEKILQVELTDTSLAWEIILDFSSNSLDGVLPDGLLQAPYSSINSIQLVLDNNRLGPGLPNHLLQDVQFKDGAKLSLSLASNLFTGDLHGSFFGDVSSSLAWFILNMDNNPLGDTVDISFFSGLSNSPGRDRTLFLSLVNCSLTGTIPNSVLGTLTSSTVRLDHNRLSGTIPLPVMFTSVVSTNPVTFDLSASYNSLQTKLDLVSAPSGSDLSVSLDFSHCDLTDLITSGNASYLVKLDISSNVGMTGNLSNFLFGATSKLSHLNASHTSLSMNIPDVSVLPHPQLNTLDLSSTAIDFCSQVTGTFQPTNPVPGALFQCSLLNTTAERKCMKKYPPTCFGLTQYPSESCPLASQPSPQFECRNNMWVSTSSVITPSIIIPTIGSPQTVLVEGNVESSSIVFNGFGTTLIINGCANNLTTITVTLTPEQLKDIGKQTTQELLVLANITCNVDTLAHVQLDSKVTGSSCRKVKATKATSNGQLSGIFAVDSSGCNRWWIILVSVICGLLVIAVVIVVLFVIFVPKVRIAFRPYSKARTAEPSVA